MVALASVSVLTGTVQPQMAEMGTAILDILPALKRGASARYLSAHTARLIEKIAALSISGVFPCGGNVFLSPQRNVRK
ncbi:MAG: hypothetical protein A07HR60_00032 [uncultured archaeon A07HR60]|nr:MAG: hypothetical protein A07HR60_00032 [uncultured archaeon A07HR60]